MTIEAIFIILFGIGTVLAIFSVGYLFGYMAGKHEQGGSSK